MFRPSTIPGADNSAKLPLFVSSTAMYFAGAPVESENSSDAVAPQS